VKLAPNTGFQLAQAVVQVSNLGGIEEIPLNTRHVYNGTVFMEDKEIPGSWARLVVAEYIDFYSVRSTWMLKE
jgi:hypothetical protein